MNVLGLVQLAQATQAFGGYSHALAIEQRVARGELATAEQLRAFVEEVLQAEVGSAEGVASGIAFRAVRCGALEDVPRLCDALSSSRVPLETRLASVQMGERLWALSRGWGWAEPVHEQLGGVARGHEMHHAVVYGALVSETTSSQVRGIAACLLDIARNLVAAAERCMPLDAVECQHVLQGVQGCVAVLAGRYAGRALGEIGMGESP